MVGNHLPTGCRAVIEALRSGIWCTAPRLKHYPLIMLVACLLGLVLLVGTSDGRMDAMRRPLGTDFSQVWTAGVEVLAGHPTAPFDPPTHARAEQDLFGADTPFYGWHYPPYFLVVAALFATLPYLAALATWQASTFALYLLSIFAILNPTLKRFAPTISRRDIAIAAAGFPAVFVNVTHGHNGFLTAALLGAGLLALRRRPVLAGMLFACLAYKPQFALIVPVALAAQGCWVAIGAGLVALALMTAAVTVLFGPGVWGAFERSLPFTRTVVLEQGNTGWEKIQSTFSAVRMLGGGIDLAYAAQFLVTGAVLLTVALAWRSRGDERLKAALLLVGSLLTTPYCLDYDLMILGPALAFVVAVGLDAGFRPWDKTIIAAAWLVPIVARPFASITHIPLGLIVMLVLFGAVARRTLAEGGLAACTRQPRGPSARWPNLGSEPSRAIGRSVGTAQPPGCHEFEEHITMSDNLPAFAADHGHLGMPERIVSVAAGLALAATAAKPRPNHLLSILALGAGAFLAYRGATGFCPARAALDV